MPSSSGCEAAAELIRAGDAPAVAAWHARRRRRPPPAARGGPRRRRAARAADRRREPARDRRRDRARARPRRRQHRGHGALSRARHAHRGDLGLGRRRRGGRSALRRSSAGSATSVSVVAQAAGWRGFEPVGPAARHAAPPPDKSISHRAALIAAMGDGGEPRSSGYLDAADTRSTLAAVQALGAEVDAIGSNRRAAKRPVAGRRCCGFGGVGLRGARPASIDVGNAGTLLRLLPGWLAGQRGGEWTLDGDESIRRRPVDRIVEPLRADGRRRRLPRRAPAPARIVAEPTLSGIEYRLPVASAQVKSCVLLAGLLAEAIDERDRAAPDPRPHRAHAARRRGDGSNRGRRRHR